MPPSQGALLYILPGVLAVVALFVLATFLIGTPALFGRGGGETLRIATTTSLDDSGLLDEILPYFEDEHNVETEVIAVGTGQAIVLGERGDVDIILVHAPALEAEFVEQGYGVERTTVMTNPFIFVGPQEDPADVASASDAGDVLSRIAESEAPFVSRGDDSGTHAKELEIWESIGVEPDTGAGWYHAAGQGMGETLLTANELEAYVLTDRATFVAIEDEQVADLAPLFGSQGEAGDGDPLLDNPYSVIAVNPEKHPQTRIELARDFIAWFNSESTRESIAEYGLNEYGEALFTLIDE
jgi:tungstate transport system substrate-binding protein